MGGEGNERFENLEGVEKEEENLEGLENDNFLYLTKKIKHRSNLVIL